MGKLCNVVVLYNLDTVTREQVIESFNDSRLILIKNKHTVPKKELVEFYRSLGDCVTFGTQYIHKEYLDEYCDGYRELVPMRNKVISGYGPPGLFAGKNDTGIVGWHNESMNRDTHDDVVCFAVERLADTGGETSIMDQTTMYDRLIKKYPEFDEMQVDWTNRYYWETPENDDHYNPWTEWDDDAIQGEGGWNFEHMTDIDDVPLINKELKYKPLVTTNTITGKKGFMFAHDAVFRLFPDDQYLLNILREECENPEYRYKHVWEQGDIAINDIQHSLHKRHPYTGDRLHYRTSIYFFENPNDPRKKHLHK